MVSVPHGGELVQLDVVDPSHDAFNGYDKSLMLPVSKETEATVLNIASGVLSPLTGFMGEEDCKTVLDSMRLSDDTPWSIPVLLHVASSFTPQVRDEIVLTDEGGSPLANLLIDERFKIDRKEYAEKVYGTSDPAHPGVARIFSSPDSVLAGRIRRFAARPGDPFSDVTLAPRETRVLFGEKSWRTIVAFQTRNPPHLSHEYVQKTALAFADGLFINPVLGKKKVGDFRDEVIVAAYKALIRNYYPQNCCVLSVLHYEMQYAGPREAIMHAIMRKNFGCTHIAIGRDHAGVGSYYRPYAAQEIFKEFPDLGITPLFFREFFYCRKCAGMANEKTCPHGEDDHLTISGTRLRELLDGGQSPPKEVMRPEVASVIMSDPDPFVR